MNCATTNRFFVNEKRLFRNGMSFSRIVANYFKLSVSAKNLLDPYIHYKMGEETYAEYKIGRSFSFGISYNL